MNTTLDRLRDEQSRRLAERGRRRFSDFVQAAWPITDQHIRLSWNWHHDAICDHMQAMMDGHITRLAVALPPRHTKSTIISLDFNAWAWIEHPGERFLTASYRGDLAIRDAERSRALMESAWYRQYYGDSFQFSSSQNVKSFYRNNQGGTRIATSVTGGATGEGGGWVMCEDPINVMDVGSESERLKVHHWWDSVMGNRLNDQKVGRMIIVAQRTHKYDLIGHVLEQGGYEYLCLPAEYEPSKKYFTSIGWADPRTEKGQPLWPDMFPTKVLEERKRVMGIDYFAQFQQEPQSDEGAIIRADKIKSYHPLYPELPLTHAEQGFVLLSHDIETVVMASQCRLVISSDYAVSKNQKNDYSVFLLWAVTGDFSCLLLDAIVEQVTGPEAEEDAASWCRLYRRRLWAILVEDVAYQKSIIQRLAQEGFPVIGRHPKGDKVARAHGIAVYFKNGQFYFPSVGFPLLGAIIKNIVEFPGVEHDDIMDAVSILLAIFEGYTPRMRDLVQPRQLSEEERIAHTRQQRLRQDNPELYKFLQTDDTVSDTIGRY